MRDRSNGLASLVTGKADNTLGIFDANKFAELMVEIGMEAQENQGMEGEEVMVMDHAFPEGAGTSTNPLDLTEGV